MLTFRWDKAKDAINKQKHGISFKQASEVFDDPYALSKIDERFDYSEERWVTLGQASDVVIVIVAHTLHEGEENDVIRIISARKATKKEQQAYRSKKGFKG